MGLVSKKKEADEARKQNEVASYTGGQQQAVPQMDMLGTAAGMLGGFGGDKKLGGEAPAGPTGGQMVDQEFGTGLGKEDDLNLLG